ncbi:hypothetical protein AVEN_150612-1 [Araneus ventricosus]|uniref:Uncharacterized protein n=1 Tax=Araneus ventricosus TaxID=182803 RepID=A0A4Y2GPJ6_ARAVE|nr:hypothetical protein AVEN_150612-1 [Araneus ventricosus]
MFYWVHVWGICWSIHSKGSFVEKEIGHYPSTMWPGVIDHENGSIPDCCSTRDRNRSEDLIPISMSRQCSIPDDVQVDAAIDRHTGPDHNSASAKSDIFVHICRIFPSSTFSSADDLPIIRLYTKAGLVREEHVAPLSSSPSEMLLRILPSTFCRQHGGPLLMKHKP